MDIRPTGEADGIPLRLDHEAESADPSLPAFLARPEDAPVYHGFPLLEQSRTEDGWCFGIISDCDCPEGRTWGDAFVVAPDNSRAGIIWDVRANGIDVSIPPEEDRWGVYCIRVEHPIHDERKLIDQLRIWLPELRRLHLGWQAGRSS